jgi:hypothetical protein
MGGIRLGMKGTRNAMFCFKGGWWMLGGGEGRWRGGRWWWTGIGLMVFWMGGRRADGGYGFFCYWQILGIGKIGFWVFGQKFLM